MSDAHPCVLSTRNSPPPSPRKCKMMAPERPGKPSHAHSRIRIHGGQISWSQQASLKSVDHPGDWCIADFSCVWAAVGLCHISFVIDVCSRHILGFESVRC